MPIVTAGKVLELFQRVAVALPHLTPNSVSVMYQETC